METLTNIFEQPKEAESEDIESFLGMPKGSSLSILQNVIQYLRNII